jgi:hypothetical protein
MSGQLNMAKPISTQSVSYIEDLICAKRNEDLICAKRNEDLICAKRNEDLICAKRKYIFNFV